MSAPKLEHRIERTIRLGVNRFTIQCSCGWCVTSDHGQTMGGLAWADHAASAPPTPENPEVSER